MITVPADDKRKLISFTQDLVEKCRVSAGMRASYYRLLNSIAETGRYNGQKSYINLLYKHLERTAAHLFSPVELKFALEYDRIYPKQMLDRAGVVGKQLTKRWSKTDTDMQFGRGVFDALKYGAAILKQIPQVQNWQSRESVYSTGKLVMPWQFGVFNEAEVDLDKQPAMCETTMMTMPEVWSRIWHLPGSKDLFRRIETHAQTGGTNADPQSYFHQVLSTSQLQTGVNGGGNVTPGGIVSLGNAPNYAIMGPMVGAPMVQVHEVWVQDENDYTTILMVEPDIIIAPLYKKANLLGVAHEHPYNLIQPNEYTNWIWGRSELVDVIEPQELLSTWSDDIKRLFGLQIDKILAFTGDNGLTDERYGQFRQAGYVNLGAGSQVTDLTPKVPPEAVPMLKFVIEIINTLAGFPDIMRGQGEAGVRAGVHASTLLKTASPTLRDRALLVERQCAKAAAKWLKIMQAKEPERYWTGGDTLEEIDKTSFLLTDIPEDWTVTVDSHSSSPIFSDENAQLIMVSQQRGIVTPEYVIDQLPFPNKEAAKASLKEAAEKKAAMMQQLAQANPEKAQDALEKSLIGGR